MFWIIQVLKETLWENFFFFNIFNFMFNTCFWTFPQNCFLLKGKKQRRKVTYIKTLCSGGKACFSFVSVIDNVKNSKKQDMSIINVKQHRV